MNVRVLGSSIVHLPSLLVDNDARCGVVFRVRKRFDLGAARMIKTASPVTCKACIRMGAAS